MTKIFGRTKIAILLVIIMVFSFCNVIAMTSDVNTKIKVEVQKQEKLKKVKFTEGKTIDGLEAFSLAESSQRLNEKNVAESSKSISEVNALTSDVITRAATNHDPNNAIYIGLDTVYSDVLTEEGQSNWYYVYVPTAGKLTAFVQTLPNVNIDYDLTVYKYNLSTGMLEAPVYSQYGPAMDEQLSSIVQPGYYFICVNSYSGFDALNPYYFIIQYSQSYDSAEPDDNILQAPQKTGSYFSVNQTLDNQFDVDWMRISLSTAKSMFITLGNVASPCVYKMDIFDSNFNGLGTLSQNTNGLISLQAGTYYFRVRSQSGFGSGYTLTVNQVANSISSIYGRSSDSRYILYTTPSGELYSNDSKVTNNGELNWRRVFYFSYGGSYTQRTQEISCGINKISGLGVYGSYTSTSTEVGNISNCFRIPVTNALYTYFYSRFVSGPNTIYEQSWYDVTGMKTPRYTDSYDDTYYGPLYLIINADTGEVKDLFADLNFYYYNNIESASFTAK